MLERTDLRRTPESQLAFEGRFHNEFKAAVDFASGERGRDIGELGDRDSAVLRGNVGALKLA